MVVGCLLMTLLLLLLHLLFHILVLHGLVQVAVVVFFRALTRFHSLVHNLLRLLVGLSAGTTPLIGVVALSFALLGAIIVVVLLRVLFILLANFFKVVAILWTYVPLVTARTLLSILLLGLSLLFQSFVVRGASVLVIFFNCLFVVITFTFVFLLRAGGGVGVVTLNLILGHHAPLRLMRCASERCLL